MKDFLMKQLKKIGHGYKDTINYLTYSKNGQKEEAGMTAARLATNEILEPFYSLGEFGAIIAAPIETCILNRTYDR